jgi:hypothetical protein
MINHRLVRAYLTCKPLVTIKNACVGDSQAALFSRLKGTSLGSARSPCMAYLLYSGAMDVACGCLESDTAPNWSCWFGFLIQGRGTR